MTTTASQVEIPASSLAAAGRALLRAGRLDDAAELIDAVQTDHPLLAVVRAEIAVTQDWFRGEHAAAEALRAAEQIVQGCGDAEAVWDLGFQTLRERYGVQLFDGTTAHFGPDGRDPVVIAELRGRAEALRDQAPDDRRRGWGEMYLGLILDNVFGEREIAPAHYQEALKAADSTGDDVLAFEALRHLGDHDHDAGDHESSGERWRRSTELAARGGALHGTLAQQILLAVLARESGNEAGAVMLAREVARWARAVGALRLAAQAQSFLGGADPTSG